MSVETVGPAGGGTAAAAGGAVERRRLLVRGVVQGVGFRPFVWGLATRLRVAGSVCNTSGGVVVEVEGAGSALDEFARALRAEAPRLARIAAVETVAVAPRGETGFVIESSRPVAGEYQPISPDAATCADCLRELLDPADRRHRHPFINCTGCGPRFTIIEDVPYDRPQTTMRDFVMCDACRAEYEDPADRRFHAQPNCCPACGPRLWLAGADGVERPGDPVTLAAQALLEGAVVAVKGLGGFQLACLAGDEAAVRRLRRRKHRPHKPFAVMVRDLAAAERLCLVSAAEAELLEGTVRPVVLLPVRDPAPPGVAQAVAPRLRELGVMLAYTPVHHLLLEAVGAPLVMTSGNVSEEPIARDNAEALERLAPIADVFLLHDRGIFARYDDSVVRMVAGAPRIVRRARGHCPRPVELGGELAGVEDVLALGAHLKNTFCVLREGHAFVGPHVGDLDSPLTLRHQEEALSTYLRLFRAAPRRVACDLHPDLASTALAELWWDAGAAPVRVQHHHAHVASVMAEQGLRGRLLGVAFDGLGYGPDGSVWGGELLLADELSYSRVGHIAAVRQPGGDLAAREGWRMAVAYLVAAGVAHDRLPAWTRTAEGAPDERRWRLVGRVAASATAAPVTTSAGRLFDAVASLLGVAHRSTFEAQAAMELEALAAQAGPVAPLPVGMAGAPLVLDTHGLVRLLVEERGRGRPAAELAAVFHESLAHAVAAACARLCGELGIDRVVLSGGVFQNALLLARALDLLDRRGLRAWANSEVPANDGGISLGQALVAACTAPGAAVTAVPE